MRLLALVLVVHLLAGCGGLTEPTDRTPAAPPATASAPAPPTADAPATVAAVASTARAAIAPTVAATGAATTSAPTPISPAIPTPPPPRPTPSPAPPTATPAPPTPMPAFQPATQVLGAIPGARGEQYTAQVTLLNVRPWPGDRYQQPAPGKVFLIADVELRNLGPASIRGLTSFDFDMIDDDRAVIHHSLLRATDSCRLELVELLPGGRVRACFGYQVLARGRLEFIFAPTPMRAEGLKPGRYLSFPLR